MWTRWNLTTKYAGPQSCADEYLNFKMSEQSAGIIILFFFFYLAAALRDVH